MRAEEPFSDHSETIITMTISTCIKGGQNLNLAKWLYVPDLHPLSSRNVFKTCLVIKID